MKVRPDGARRGEYERPDFGDLVDELGGERRGCNMKILLTINGTDIGGTESALAQLAVELHRRGHRVEVMSLKSPGRMAPRLREAGIAVATLGMGESVSLAGLSLAVLRLRRWLGERDFEVVHSFLPRANIASRVANRLSRRPASHISSERSTDFNRARVVSSLNRLTARWTDVTLAVSDSVRTVLIERDRLSASKVSVLENGLDLASLDQQQVVSIRDELSLPAGALIFCSVGRLVPDKGHLYLLQALARMKKREPVVHLALVGDGPEGPALRRVARDLGLGQRVHFLGVRADVPAILKGVDGFALPSLEEGVSVALLEAMACSCPVVATRVGGNPEIVEHEVSGFLVDAAESWEDAQRQPRRSAPTTRSVRGTRERGIASLAAALDRLVGEPALRERLGRQARRTVEKRFDLRQVVSRLERIYQAPGAVASVAREESDSSGASGNPGTTTRSRVNGSRPPASSEPAEARRVVSMQGPES